MSRMPDSHMELNDYLPVGPRGRRLWVEFGRAHLPSDTATGLEEGSIIELSSGVDDPVTVYTTGVPVACGEPVEIEGQLAVRITALVGSNEPANKD